MNPSENNRVIKGGIFNVAKTQYSPETRKIVNQLIEESRLSLQLRRRMQEALDSGQPLQASDARARPTGPSRCAQAHGHAGVALLLPPRLARRPLHVIERSGAYEREHFRPKQARDREKERSKLQNIMAYGKAEVPMEDLGKKINNQRKEVKETTLPNDDEIIDHLLKEIEERLQFLDEMRELGQEKNYRTIIMSEIACKLRQIEKMDKNRSMDISENVNKQLNVKYL